MVKKSALATVVVAGWTLDNAGNYHKAGTELTVDDEGGEGCIASARAEALAAVEAGRVLKAPEADTDTSGDEQTGDA